MKNVASIFFCLLVCSASLASEKLPPPRNGNLYVVAHRGAHKAIPENTIAAYRKAIELGVDFIEVDIRSTKDGHLVSFHDANVTIDGVSRKISELTLEEIKAVDIGSRVSSKWVEERVPTLEEIVSLCKGKVGIYLDLKSAPVEAVLDVVRNHDMLGHVLWYADENQLKDLLNLCPDALVMPDPGSIDNLSYVLEAFSPLVIAAVWKCFTPEMVNLCHARGVKIIVDEGRVTPPENVSCWEEALAWGADGIQTDHPEELIAFLNARRAE